jgi:hypothetical protein
VTDNRGALGRTLVLVEEALRVASSATARARPRVSVGTLPRD